MKKLIVIFVVSLFLITACKAQQPVVISKMSNVKANSDTYKLNRPNAKVVIVSNSSNKLRGVEGIAPNVPSGVIMKQYMKYDRSIITSICADAISLQTLQKSPKGYNEYLFMTLKISNTGYPLEMSFLLQKNSLITADQIQRIEKEIFKSKFKITYKPEVQKFLLGANYFEIDVIVTYDELLKIKENSN